MNLARIDPSLPRSSAANSGLPAMAGGARLPTSPTPPTSPTSPTSADSPAALITAALAYLAQHMQTGCTRSGAQAAMLLERLASDTRADVHLRQHARQLAEILDDDPQLAAAAEASALETAALEAGEVAACRTAPPAPGRRGSALETLP